MVVGVRTLYSPDCRVNDKVHTGPRNPGKSLNLNKSFCRPGKSWNSDAGPGKSKFLNWATF